MISQNPSKYETHEDNTYCSAMSFGACWMSCNELPVRCRPAMTAEYSGWHCVSTSAGWLHSLWRYCSACSMVTAAPHGHQQAYEHIRNFIMNLKSPSIIRDNVKQLYCYFLVVSFTAVYNQHTYTTTQRRNFREGTGWFGPPTFLERGDGAPHFLRPLGSKIL